MPENPMAAQAMDAAAADAGPAPAKPGLKQRAVSEAKRFLVMTLYLWVLFATFSLHKTLILRQADINVGEQGFAIVNALVLAKVMLIADELKLGRHFQDRPLIWSVLWNSFLFALILIAFHVLENVAVALVKGQPAASGLAEVGGGNVRALLSVGALTFVSLIPFFAVQDVARVLGSGSLWQLFFARGSKRFSLVVQD